MSLPSEVDIAIIGAGAAGLGAARALGESGLNILVLEARYRVGGRAHTVIASENVTFDVGCGWLHSADENSFVPIAQKLGFEIDQKRPRWRDQSLQHRLCRRASRGVPEGARCILGPLRRACAAA